MHVPRWIRPRSHWVEVHSHDPLASPSYSKGPAIPVSKPRTRTIEPQILPNFLQDTGIREGYKTHQEIIRGGGRVTLSSDYGCASISGVAYPLRFCFWQRVGRSFLVSAQQVRTKGPFAIALRRENRSTNCSTASHRDAPRVFLLPDWRAANTISTETIFGAASSALFATAAVFLLHLRPVEPLDAEVVSSTYK